MIEAVAPRANLLIVTRDGNKDGRFSKISTEKNIPLVEVNYALEIVDLLKKVFDKPAALSPGEQQAELNPMSQG